MSPCRITSYNVCYTKLLRAEFAKALDDTGYQGTVPTAMVAGTAKPWSRDGRTLVLGVVAIIGLTGAAVGLAMREPAPERPVVRFEVVSPTSGAFPVVTPDGRRVIWGTQDGVLYERSLDGLTTSRFGDSVITSYSIHYTKLYDETGGPQRHAQSSGGIDGHFGHPVLHGSRSHHSLRAGLV